MREGCDLLESQLPLILAQHWELPLLPTAQAANLSNLPPGVQDSLLWSVFALCSAISCTFTAESRSLSPCCPKHWLQLVGSICHPCNSYMQGYTERRGCCDAAARLRWRQLMTFLLKGTLYSPGASYRYGPAHHMSVCSR